ncbi:MAG: TerB N-terminal domain-containing protein [Vicinamibacteria bacterium]|nr:TerB N-terminal domain-containing protein [Vicinamibacteria bacterium]
MEILIGLLCFGASVLMVGGLLVAFVRGLAGSQEKPPKPMRQSAGRGITVTIRSSHDAVDDRPDDARWYGPGEGATVAGLTLSGGCLYVGKHLASVSRISGVEPALINPTLRVQLERVDSAGISMPYWPRYSEIGPECRGAYLRWLAGGRRDPTVGVGYVFLFLYGLERRVLHDAGRQDLAQQEWAAILREIEELLKLYGPGSRSFNGYASDFLDVAKVRAGRPFALFKPPDGYEKGSWPAGLRLGLAEFAAGGRPIPPEWALAWARFHPEVRFPTAATRCAEELERLFEVRYRERFGTGLTVAPNRTKLTLSYRPASASFGGVVTIPVRDLPDVTVLSAPIQKIREIVDSCVLDLEPYSRLLGKDSKARGSIAAEALLPKGLSTTTTGGEVERLSELIRRSTTEHDFAVLECADVLSLWPAAQADGKLAKAEAVILGQFLQKSSYGMEPDVRFSGRVPKIKEKLVVFPLPANAGSSPTEQFRGAAALLHMAVLVAQADGSVSGPEEERLIGHLESALQMDAAEKIRLHAHLRWLIANGGTLGEVKKRIDHIAADKRRAIGDFLIGIAAADGRLDRKEIDVLRKLYALLGIEEASLYADIHSLGVADDLAPKPLTAQKGSAAGLASLPPAPDSQGFALDPARIQAKMRESAVVAAMLQNIFVEDEQEGTVLAAVGSGGATIAGLDAAHSALLRVLAGRQTWSRTDVETQATGLGLMTDGAIEVVNERAFDVCGEPLFEGEDPLSMNPNVMKELLA